MLAVESCSAFASAQSKEGARQQLLPVVQKFAQVSFSYGIGRIHLTLCVEDMSRSRSIQQLVKQVCHNGFVEASLHVVVPSVHNN